MGENKTDNGSTSGDLNSGTGGGGLQQETNLVISNAIVLPSDTISSMPWLGYLVTPFSGIVSVQYSDVLCDLLAPDYSRESIAASNQVFSASVIGIWIVIMIYLTLLLAW